MWCGKGVRVHLGHLLVTHISAAGGCMLIMSSCTHEQINMSIIARGRSHGWNKNRILLCSLQGITLSTSVKSTSRHAFYNFGHWNEHPSLNWVTFQFSMSQWPLSDHQVIKYVVSPLGVFFLSYWEFFLSYVFCTHDQSHESYFN